VMWVVDDSLYLAKDRRVDRRDKEQAESGGKRTQDEFRFRDHDKPPLAE
jgi:hypothetical protein